MVPRAHHQWHLLHSQPEQDSALEAASQRLDTAAVLPVLADGGGGSELEEGGERWPAAAAAGFAAAGASVVVVLIRHM